MSRPRSGGFGRAFEPYKELETQLRRKASPEKFWARVDRNGPVVVEALGPCWPWTGPTNKDGYGLTSWCRRDLMAHRLAFALANERIPTGKVVRHRCDNAACCNPAHLELGSIAQNNQDIIDRGRYTPKEQRGETNPLAKLTDDRVRELRAAWRAGESIKSIAERTGLAVGTVHPMLHGKTWKHVTEAAPRQEVFVRYKLRAEVPIDVSKLADALSAAGITARGWAVEQIDPDLPDVTVEFDTVADLPALLAVLATIEDGHVMHQTIQPLAEFTGERVWERAS